MTHKCAFIFVYLDSYTDNFLAFGEEFNIRLRIKTLFKANVNLQSSQAKIKIVVNTNVMSFARCSLKSAHSSMSLQQIFAKEYEAFARTSFFFLISFSLYYMYFLNGTFLFIFWCFLAKNISMVCDTLAPDLFFRKKNMFIEKSMYLHTQGVPKVPERTNIS